MAKRIVAVLLSIVMLMGCCIVPEASANVDLPYVGFGSYSPLKTKCMSTLGLSSDEYDELNNGLYYSLSTFKEKYDISKFNIPVTKKNMNLIGEIIAEYSNIFYIKYTFLFACPADDSYLAEIYYEYIHEQSEVTELQKEIDRAANEIIYDLVDNDKLTDAEKVLIVHDRIAIKCEYDTDGVNAADADTSKVPPDDFTIYGALVNECAVCEGYSRALSYLLGKLGISSYLCVSTTLHHMWNIVMIDGKAYHVDVTYDDTIPDVYGNVKHSYLLISTEKLNSLGRTQTDYYKTPVSSDYENMYYTESRTQVVYTNGALYYYDNNANCLKKRVNSVETVLFTDENHEWCYSEEQIWDGNFSRIAYDSSDLYFSTVDKIYKYDIDTGKVSAFYTPVSPVNADYDIYGLAIDNGKMYITLYNSPNFKLTTTAENTIIYDYIPAYTAGDINSDNKVNVQDCNLIKYIIMGKTPGEINQLAADINKDGKVNVLDANLLKRIILGLSLDE